MEFGELDQVTKRDLCTLPPPGEGDYLLLFVSKCSCCPLGPLGLDFRVLGEIFTCCWNNLE